jgi:mannan endo-1,4-beta-mannosidase
MNLKLCFIIFFGFCLFHSGKGQAPVNPDASPEARALLSYLYEISGKQTLSGNHNYNGRPDQFTRAVQQITGKTPVIWGSDFAFRTDKDQNSRNRPAMIEEAERQWKNGSIVTLMWHAVRPIDDDNEVAVWAETIQGELTDEEWNEFLTPGTPLNQKWIAQIDEIAEYLKILRDKNIPVLWRPYHEMNGKWFWWGYKTGPDGFARLWKSMYDRYVNYHHLDNLIWVWNANAPRDRENDTAFAYSDFFPGPEYADVLAADVYHSDYKQSHHDDLKILAAGKPISLGECGQLPTPEVLEKQPYWTWFMCWANWVSRPEINTEETVRALYNCRQVQTKENTTWTVPKRLAVIWTSGDPEVAEKICFMYTQAAQNNNWFCDVRLVVWGPSAKLLTENKTLQKKLKAMQESGIKVEACIACANMYGVADNLKKMGIDVKGMGVPLSEYLKKDNTEVISF